MNKLTTITILAVIILVGVNTVQTDEASTPPAFNKQQFSATDPGSAWVIVNKQRPLTPKTYIPTNLVIADVPLRANITDDESKISAIAAPSLKSMVAAAKKQGLQLDLQSGFRSYEFQAKLYGHYVAEQGTALADSLSAKPGYSEHQTGLAVDIGSIANPDCNVRICFATTAEGYWLAQNAYKYGFIERYPKDKQKITDYEYEPWHLRYVGVLLAKQIHDQNSITMEEFFDMM